MNQLKNHINGARCLALLLATALPGSSALMENETVVFCSDFQPGTARLLFAPQIVMKVQRADGSQVYEEGVDYTIDAAGEMVLTDTTRIPVLNYFKPVMEEGTYRFTDTAGRYFYSPGGIAKHKNYDVVVTYTYADGSLEEMMSGHWASKLSRARQKLEAKAPLNVTFWGDSITFGAQASGLPPGYVPYAPPYAVRIVEVLKKHFGYAGVNYANKSVGGKTSAWGLQELHQVIATAPDLVFLAFGMNDSSGNTPAHIYKQNVADMIQSLRAAIPEVEIVLVAPFYPNPDWERAHYALRNQNRDDLRELHHQFDHTGFIDVGAVSQQIQAKKKFQDISGNNLNHPNDFMHRIYADLALRLFGVLPDRPSVHSSR